MAWRVPIILGVSLVGFAAQALAESLLVSHFSGRVYTLELKLSPCAATGELSVTSSIDGCGLVPSWLTFDSKTSTLYCFDEDNNGTGVVTSYSVAKSGALAVSGSAPTTGGDVHGWLYGGPDGRSFLSMAE
jgi:6-phosphogluconolactonase (cycloisomerase 2 family)